MQVPIVKLSESKQTIINNIVKASKEKTTCGQQMLMANYYAFLNSKNEADKLNIPKLLINK